MTDSPVRRPRVILSDAGLVVLARVNEATDSSFRPWASALALINLHATPVLVTALQLDWTLNQEPFSATADMQHVIAPATTWIWCDEPMLTSFGAQASDKLGMSGIGMTLGSPVTATLTVHTATGVRELQVRFDLQWLRTGVELRLPHPQGPRLLL